MKESVCLTGELDHLIHRFIKDVCSHDVYICTGLLFGIIALRIWMKRKE